MERESLVARNKPKQTKQLKQRRWVGQSGARALTLDEQLYTTGKSATDIPCGCRRMRLERALEGETVQDSEEVTPPRLQRRCTCMPSRPHSCNKTAYLDGAAKSRILTFASPQHPKKSMDAVTVLQQRLLHARVRQRGFEGQRLQNALVHLRAVREGQGKQSTCYNCFTLLTPILFLNILHLNILN